MRKYTREAVFSNQGTPYLFLDIVTPEPGCWLRGNFVNRIRGDDSHIPGGLRLDAPLKYKPEDFSALESIETLFETIDAELIGDKE